jgi:hypothetical protein
MALNSHYRQMFADNVQELAGAPNRSFLKQAINFKPGKGEFMLLDAIGAPSGFASKTVSTDFAKASTSLRTRKAHEADIGATPANDTHANLRLMATPHIEPTRQRTQSAPRLIETGHTFNEVEDILSTIDSKGPVMQQLMREIFWQEDSVILEAIAAATVNRQRYGGMTADNITFPTAQALTHVDASSKFGIEALTDILKRFELNYLFGEEVFVLINPAHKKNLIDEDGGKLHSTDFVDSARYFMEGTLPKVYGCVVLVHPLVPATKYYAWTKNGLTWVEYKALATDMGPDPGERFQDVGYIREHIDCKRVDDLRVIHGTIATE